MMDVSRYGWGNDRAVSPVVGSIMLVLLAVVGAAIVTSLFLGFGAQSSVAASINLQYDRAEQGASVTLVDRKQAQEVEVRYQRAGDEAAVTLMAAGSRVKALKGEATLRTSGRVRWPAGEGAPGGGAAADTGAAHAADAANVSNQGRNATAARFDEPLREGDVLRVTVIAHRDQDSSVIADKEFELR